MRAETSALVESGPRPDGIDARDSRRTRGAAKARRRNKVYSETLDALGREDEKISNIRESMVPIERLLLFLKADDADGPAPKPLECGVARPAVAKIGRELQRRRCSSSSTPTLGLINLAQNDIIKLFLVPGVIFMPPTVIALIYGMNFKVMPELEWHLGYPLAIFLMVCAAVARHWSVSDEPRELLVDAKLGEVGASEFDCRSGPIFWWHAFASRPAALLSEISSPSHCSALRCSRQKSVLRLDKVGRRWRHAALGPSPVIGMPCARSMIGS